MTKSATMAVFLRSMPAMLVLACQPTGGWAPGPTDECGFSPCGGDPRGRWETYATCMKEETTYDFDETIPPCASLPAEITETFDGWVEYASGLEDWALMWRRTVDVLIPLACFAALQADASEWCHRLNERMTSGGEQQGSCSAGQSGCRCIFDEAIEFNGGYDYYIDGNEIRYEDYPNDIVPFCQRGVELKFAFTRNSIIKFRKRP